MDIRNNLFTERLFKTWKSLPKEVVESLCLEVFQQAVNVPFKGACLGFGSARLMVGFDDLRAPFQFCDSEREQYYNYMQ